MARLALPQRQNSLELLPLLGAALLFASAGALAALFSMVQVPSSAMNGLPADWAHRASWIAVEALLGLGVACALLALAGRRSLSASRS